MDIQDQELTLKKNPSNTLLWKYFKVFKNKKQKNFAFCVLCRRQVNYSKSYSTSALSHHLRYNHKAMHEEYMRGQLQKSPLHSACINDHFRVEIPTAEDKLIDWIIRRNIPISEVEAPEFRSFCNSLNKNWEHISRPTAMDNITKKYIREKDKLLLKIRKPDIHYAITTDSWTSCANEGYVAMTLHYIDPTDWVLHDIVLGCFAKEGPATAEEVVAQFEHSMREFELSYNNLVSVVTDTAPNMVATGHILDARAHAHANYNHGACHWHGCAAHILELQLLLNAFFLLQA